MKAILHWNDRARQGRGCWTVVIKKGAAVRHIDLDGSIAQHNVTAARAAARKACARYGITTKITVINKEAA